MKAYLFSFIVVFLGITSYTKSQNFWQATGYSYGGEVNAIIQANNGNIVACGNDKIYISTNGGTTWSQTASLSYELNCITKNDTNGYLFVGRNASSSNQYGGVYRSINNGQSWVSSGLPNRRIKTITVNTNGIVFTGSKGDYPNHTGVYKSTDNGTNWIPSGLLTYDIYILYSDNNGNVFAGTGNDGALFKSPDNGSSWNLIYSWGVTIVIQAFTIDQSGNYFITQGNGKIFKSINQGASWVEVYNTYESETCLLVNQANTIYCGINGGGVIKSEDAGNIWTAINSGLTNVSVQSLTIDTLCYLYAGLVNSVNKSIQPTCIIPPGTPTLINPPNNSTGISLTPTLDWTDVSTANTYDVQVSTSSSFSSTVVNAQNLTNSSYTIPTGLLSSGTVYYWRARAVNSGGPSPWSIVWNFTTIQQYLISTSSNPSSGGTTTGGGYYQSGQTATVIATPSIGWNFNNWTENGNVVSTNATYSFTVIANRALVANFSQINYQITTSSNPTSGGTTSGGGTYNYGLTPYSLDTFFKKV